MNKTIKHTNLITTILVLTILCFFSACGIKKSMVSPQSSIENEPKIIFLNYNIKKTSNGNKRIQFINKVIADGKLKNTKPNEEGVQGDLVCLQLDKKSNILQRSIVKNPLIKNIEFLDESKSFQRKEIDLDSTQFSIRLQLKPNTKHISIIDFSTFENQGKTLAKTQIH